MSGRIYCAPGAQKRAMRHAMTIQIRQKPVPAADLDEIAEPLELEKVRETIAELEQKPDLRS